MCTHGFDVGATVIARVDVPGTTIAGIAIDARLDRDGDDFVLSLTSWPLGAVELSVRMSRLEAVTLCGAIHDVAVSDAARNEDST